MDAIDDYDPESDLALLRSDSSSRFATYAVAGTMVFVFGTYLQSLAFVLPPNYTTWLHGKVVVLLALFATAVSTSKLRPVARILYPAVTFATVAESTAWVVALFSLGAISYFACAVVLMSLIALALTPTVFRSVGRAIDARERLAANGLDDPFA